MKPKKGTPIYFMGSNTPVKWKYDDKAGLTITTPATLLNSVPEADRLAYTFKIECQ